MSKHVPRTKVAGQWLMNSPLLTRQNTMWLLQLLSIIMLFSTIVAAAPLDACRRISCYYEYQGPRVGLSACDVKLMERWALDQINAKTISKGGSWVEQGITFDSKDNKFFGRIQVRNAWCQPHDSKLLSEPPIKDTGSLLIPTGYGCDHDKNVKCHGGRRDTSCSKIPWDADPIWGTIAVSSKRSRSTPRASFLLHRT